MSVGYHFKKGDVKNPADGGYANAIIEAYNGIGNMGIPPCLQIFVMGPGNTTITVSDKDKEILSKWTHAGNIIVHGAYVNIPWSLKPYIVHQLKSEFAATSDIGANGLVVHLHSKASDKKVMEHVLTSIASLPANILAGPRIWLENKPSKSGIKHCTPKEVKELFEMIQTINPRPKIGFCIDTQHSFASGIDLAKYDDTYEWLDSLRAALPDEFPMMIHLNDSKSKKGSGVDKHEGLFSGEIWSGYGHDIGKEDPSTSGAVACILWAEENNAYVILETPDPVNDLKYLAPICFT